MTSGTKTFDTRHHEDFYCGRVETGYLQTKVWSGGDDPRLHKKVNTYVMDYLEEMNGPITLLDSREPGVSKTCTYKAYFGGISNPPLEWSANDEISLINKLGDNIRGHSFDAANTLGAEGRDSLKQLAGAAEAFAKGMRAVRHADLSALKGAFSGSDTFTQTRKFDSHKFTGNLVNDVLATQLGWLPLMSDISSAYDALRAISGRPISRTYSATHQISAVVTPPPYPNHECGKKSISKRLVWTMSEPFTFWDSIACSNPWDIANMAWQATTLSFIADWFVPISSYLSARSVVNKLSGSGFVTRIDRTHGKTIYVDPKWFSISGTPYFYKSLHLDRSLVSSLSVPLPTFKDFNQIPSWRRALTAVALAAQSILKG